MNQMQKEIVIAGQKLASINPSASALTVAREWWKNGRLNAYSNQDFDILNGLNQSILAAK